MCEFLEYTRSSRMRLQFRRARYVAQMTARGGSGVDALYYILRPRRTGAPLIMSCCRVRWIRLEGVVVWKCARSRETMPARTRCDDGHHRCLSLVAYDVSRARRRYVVARLFLARSSSHDKQLYVPIHALVAFVSKLRCVGVLREATGLTSLYANRLIKRRCSFWVGRALSFERGEVHPEKVRPTLDRKGLLHRKRANQLIEKT